MSIHSRRKLTPAQLPFHLLGREALPLFMLPTALGNSKFVTASMEPDAAARGVDCQQITQGLGMHFIHGAEGFLVIESTHSLDVIVVYTAGKGDAASIDVEQVQERRLR